MSNSFASAQEISFFHLNTGNGLSDNVVSAAVKDKKGILWIGTAEGLNSYDGYSIKKYYKEDYPSMSSNDILSLFIDDEDRIWMRDMAGKVTLIDEKRNFIPVPVIENGKEITAYSFFKTKQRGVCVLSGKTIFVLSKQQPLRFEKLNWQGDTSLHTGYVQVKANNNDTLIIISANRLTVFDARQLKVLHTIYVHDIIGAAWLNNNELLVTTGQNQQLLKVNLAENRITHNYGTLKDQYGEEIKGYLRHIRKLPDARFIMTSGYGGVYIFDAAQEKFYRYGHDPLNVRSICANNTAHVFTDSNGYVFITSRTAGLSYFNYNYQPAAYRTAFQETTSGKIFHGFVNHITRHKTGNYWLGTQTGLVEWNREMNTVKFHDYGQVNNVPLSGIEEVRALFFDKYDNLWVGLNRYGIVVLDKNRKVIKYLSRTSSSPDEKLPGNWINSFTLSPDNKLWVGAGGGLCIINPETMKVEPMDDNNPLKPLSKIHCYSVYFRKNGEAWIGTSRGAYRYIQTSGRLTRLSPSKDSIPRQVYCFTEDKNGILYAGAINGIALIKDTTVIKTYSRLNGLVSDNCFGLMRDAENYIWIGNDNILLRYNPDDSSFKKYDESAGLNPNGYRLLSYYQAENGEQIWGSDIGLSYFFPGKMKQLEFPLHASINSFTAGGKNYPFSSATKISVPYKKNNLQFFFSAIDLFSSKNILFQYILSGAENDWKNTSAPQEVSYSNLPPGNYIFRVRVSRDGINWVEASNPVSIHILTPWWRTTGFVILYCLVLVSSVYYLIRSRNRKIQEHKERLETEQAINYFATSMTGYRTVEDTLWDVARNCIARLGFEDCVIYLKDEKRNVLVQKAAWGPKTTNENKILNPLEIPVNQGIVGYVAYTGIAEIINDTSKDERYIVDDEKRFSEITVPIISDGKVLGVIDSEHPRKNFFTPKQLSILTTIASICANKIVRARAEEEKQKAENKLLETKRETAEMEMQALRAQMNPHFLFNCLNSINNFILKNDPDNASQYLTSFSRLMRLILDNSREDWVLLENEIKALQLYVEMEAIRFDNVFTYHIRIAPDVDTGSVMVPPMIVQPYIENAIWHGLLHRKEPGSKLDIDIWKQNGYLCIKVEDNGVGREEAKRLKSKFSSHKQSHGMMITAKRLETVNTIYDVGASVEIDDRENGNGKATGTSVLLRLKYKQNHSLK